MHVAGAQFEVPFTQHGFAEIGVGAGIILPADDDDFLSLAARDFHAQVGPGKVGAAIAVYFSQLSQADLVERIIRVQEHGQGIVRAIKEMTEAFQKISESNPDPSRLDFYAQEIKKLEEQLDDIRENTLIR